MISLSCGLRGGMKGIVWSRYSVRRKRYLCNQRLDNAWWQLLATGVCVCACASIRSAECAKEHRYVCTEPQHKGRLRSQGLLICTNHTKGISQQEWGVFLLRVGCTSSKKFLALATHILQKRICTTLCSMRNNGRKRIGPQTRNKQKNCRRTCHKGDLRRAIGAVYDSESGTQNVVCIKCEGKGNEEWVCDLIIELVTFLHYRLIVNRH